MTRRWRPSIILLATGVIGAALLITDGSSLAGAGFLVLLALFAALLSPRAFPHSITDAQARAAQSQDGHPIVYWRPGCPYCMRLRTSLGRGAAGYHWVDIWNDPAGAATVRSVTGGDETVPTVVAVDQSYVNPAPQLVRQLASRPR